MSVVFYPLTLRVCIFNYLCNHMNFFTILLINKIITVLKLELLSQRSFSLIKNLLPIKTLLFKVSLTKKVNYPLLSQVPGVAL